MQKAMPKFDQYSRDPMGHTVESVDRNGTKVVYYTTDRSNTFLDRPGTARRPKPTDLFLGSTARTVRSFYRENTDSQITKTAGYPYVDGFRPTKTVWRRFLPTFNGPFGLGPYEPRSVSTWNEATRKALLEIKSQKVNLTVSVPELGKTTDMVANLARSVVSALRSFRKGDLSQLVRAVRQPATPLSRDLASKWLQLQYGWRPLMSDIYGLSEEIDRKMHDVGVFVYGSATHKMSQSFTEKEFPNQSAQISGSSVTKYKTKYRYKVDSATAARLKHIGLSNPALTIWELIPYSFVVDWVIDVGGYLELLDATVGLSEVICIQSVRYDAQATFQHDLLNSHHAQFPFRKALGQYVWSTSIRGSPGAFPGPPRPTYKPNLSTTRMISALALLRNLFK